MYGMPDTFLQKKFGCCCENDPLIHFIHLNMEEYDSKCHKMYLITLKVFKICYQISLSDRLPSCLYKI
jgi:hypothetical protein